MALAVWPRRGNPSHEGVCANSCFFKTKRHRRGWVLTWAGLPSPEMIPVKTRVCDAFSSAGISSSAAGRLPFYVIECFVGTAIKRFTASFAA